MDHDIDFIRPRYPRREFYREELDDFDHRMESAFGLPDRTRRVRTILLVVILIEIAGIAAILAMTGPKPKITPITQAVRTIPVGNTEPAPPLNAGTNDRPERRGTLLDQ